jgi:hypothetical protein
MTDTRSKQAVEVAERFADGLADSIEVEEAREGANEACRLARGLEYTSTTSCAYLALDVFDVYKAASTCAQWATQSASCHRDTERKAQADILRDLFVHPLYPVGIDPSFLTPSVFALAEEIYCEKSFDVLPILGDALEDAGCRTADILRHCRFPGMHIRGCWVLDLLLGKE